MSDTGLNGALLTSLQTSTSLLDKPRFSRGGIGAGRRHMPSLPRTVPLGVRDKLRHAILLGNRPCQQSVEPHLPRAHRRALLIAEQYLDDPEFTPLKTTPCDILRVYNMLLSRGYHTYDIRLLASGMGAYSQDDDLQCAPTKENIMASLEWLVNGTEAGDYRYFHFSGHGISCETSFEKGKVARIVPRSTTLIPGSYPEPDTDTGERIMCEIIQASELKYYNEAIVTQWVPGSDSGSDSNRIYDRELNRELAKLPKHSYLTVTLDCCHSGRMINSNHKLAGAGFRGALAHRIWQLEAILHPSVRVLPRALSTSQPQELSPITHLGSIVELTRILMLGVFGLLKCAQLILYALAYSVFAICYPARVVLPSIYSLQLMGFVLVVDKLPERERCMDSIQATLFHWSSCHQQQQAMEYGDHKGGYFTYAIEQIPSSGSTVDEIYQDVERALTAAVEMHNHKYKSSHIQSCQLWTSLGNDDELLVKERLHLPFTL
ncbi:unnamed protein product [Rhizoctonia solani]|uniref:Rhodanese domain-containing protein n=1 Tax=Rhizoctonia solani TaxID=456999 RepID=A0A8H3BGF5_9AGAM|nr:unnamed protein product [Rhizoctonia solani]